MSSFWLEVRSAIWRRFPAAAVRHPRPVDWSGEMVSFSLFREGLDIILLQKKIFFFLFIIFNSIYFQNFQKSFFFFIILNSIYFQAIQTAVFYQKKNRYKNFRPNFLMFLDHRVSCDQNKKLKLRKNWLSKGGFGKLVGSIVKA